MRIIYGGVLERHPGLRVICPHLGGVVPFLLWRLQGHPGKEGSGESGAGLPHRLSYYLDKVLFDSVTLHGPAMRCACDTFGPERMVLGTDFPFVDGPGMKKIRQLIDGLPITAQQREGILEKNMNAWIR
jgi:aminocarboxymuconate-semialdehyde decarboxylase